VTVQDLQAHRGLYFGASVALEVVGALGTETAPDAKSAVIASLVVAPAWQRRGIGRRLLTAALAACGPIEVSVSTGARNAPALALYASFGFVEAARRTLGPERIEVVTLRRSA
jgi:ribosomal protein S18 acetylase RimI-like enzyme